MVLQRTTATVKDTAPIGDVRVLIATLFLPVTLELGESEIGERELYHPQRQQPSASPTPSPLTSSPGFPSPNAFHQLHSGKFAPTMRKQTTDSLAATAPPSRYHFRTESDPSKLPFIPHLTRTGASEQRPGGLVDSSKRQFKFIPSNYGNIGMHKAVESYGSQRRGEIVYIGELGGSLAYSDNLSSAEQTDIRLKLRTKHRSIPVFVSEAEMEGHYQAFCKEILWPTMHYILPECIRKNIDEKSAWNHYVEVNQKFADIISENYSPGDIVWIHDYHLLLVPMMLRQKRPNAIISFFLHVPFPSSEVFRCLFVRKDLLVGLLGADLIGFQTYPFARHFLQTCSRILAYEATPKGIQLENTVVSVGIFPIGIDINALNIKRRQPEVAEMIKVLQEKYIGKKIIVARDKLDPVKGVRQKLQAFQLFLETFPEWQGKVVLVQVALSTTEHQELQSQISDIASRINSKYGTIEYTPVVYLHQDISFSHYLALLTIADACLITSLRDGMNLTSHEYVACQEQKHSPLIISEFTGTYGSFGAAFRVNPWNIKEVAQAINDALILPEDEKIRCHRELLRHVTSNTGSYWAERFVTEAQKMACDMQRRFSAYIPHLEISPLIDRYKQTKNRYFFFNYDGTLVSYEKTPDILVTSARLTEVITRLCSNSNNKVFVVSGRTKGALDARLGHIKALGLSAENGCFLKNPYSNHWEQLFSENDISWQDKVMEIFEYYTERTPGSFIEKKDLSLVWHYRMADHDFGSWQARECQNHMVDALETVYPIHAILGKKNIEVRPKTISKGSLISHVLACDSHVDFVMTIGGDRSDEDMFEAMEQLKQDRPSTSCYSCAIGSKTFKADCFLTGVPEVLDFLEALANTNFIA